MDYHSYVCDLEQQAKEKNSEEDYIQALEEIRNELQYEDDLREYECLIDDSLDVPKLDETWKPNFDPISNQKEFEWTEF